MKKIKPFLLGLLLTLGGGALAATFNTFTPVTGILKGNANSPVTTATLSTDVISLWSGTCNASTFLRADGSCQAAGTPPAGANTQVQFNNAGAFGASSNFTWTGTSLSLTTPAGLNPGVIVNGNAAGAPIYEWNDQSVAANSRRWWLLSSGSFQLFAVDDAGTPGHIGLQIDRTTGTTNIVRSLLAAGGSRTLGISDSGEVRVNGSPGAAAQVLTSGGAGALATWSAAPVTTPGGADTQVQYNNAGAFAGDAGLTYNAGTDTLTTSIFTANTGVLAPGLTSLGALTVAATGANSFTVNTNSSGRLTIGSGGDWLVGGTVGSAGQVFTSNGAGTPPSWQAAGGVSGANPTATIGLTAVNGAAGTFLRSDGAPALSQAIAPTWTQQHIFSLVGGNTDSALLASSTTPVLELRETDAAVDNRRWRSYVSGEQLRFDATNEAGTVAANWLTVDRTGTTIDSIALAATTATVNGQSICRADGTGCPASGAPIICATSGGCNITTITVGQTAIIRKASTTSRSSTITEAIDPDLQFTTTSGHIFEVEYCLRVNGSTTGTQGLRVEFGQDGGGSSAGFAQGVGNFAGTVTTVAGSWDVRQVTVSTLNVSASVDNICGSGTVNANASVQGVLWAQNTSNANATNMLSNSFITFRRIG